MVCCCVHVYSVYRYPGYFASYVRHSDSEVQLPSYEYENRFANLVDMYGIFLDRCKMIGKSFTVGFLHAVFVNCSQDFEKIFKLVLIR